MQFVIDGSAFGRLWSFLSAWLRPMWTLVLFGWSDATNNKQHTLVAVDSWPYRHFVICQLSKLLIEVYKWLTKWVAIAFYSLIVWSTWFHQFIVCYSVPFKWHAQFWAPAEKCASPIATRTWPKNPIGSIVVLCAKSLFAVRFQFEQKQRRVFN